MDFTQSMDNGYMIPTSVAVGSVEDFKTFLDATGMELRYEGLVTYEKVNKLLKVYKGNDTWQTVGEGGGNVDASSFITLTQLSQQLNNYYTKTQTENFVSDEIAKIELKEGPVGPQGPKGDTGEQGPQGPAGVVDTTNFYDKEQIDTKLSNIILESGNIVFRDIMFGEIFEIIADTDAPVVEYGNIIISDTSLTVNENNTTTFTVKLDKAPTNNQVVNISVNNAYCTLNKSNLTFTPNDYSIAQTVAVNGVYDSANYSDKSSIITVSSGSVSSRNISVNIKNIDSRPEQPSGVTPVVDLDISNWDGSARLVDKCGNYDFTIKHVPSYTKTEDNGILITQSSPATSNFVRPSSYSVRMKANIATLTNAYGRLWRWENDQPSMYIDKFSNEVNFKVSGSGNASYRIKTDFTNHTNTVTDIICCFDSATSKAHMYINGKPLGQGAYNGSYTNPAVGNALAIGNVDSNTYNIDFTLYKFQVYDKSLSKEEVEVLYNEG